MVALCCFCRKARSSSNSISIEPILSSKWLCKWSCSSPVSIKAFISSAFSALYFSPTWVCLAFSSRNRFSDTRSAAKALSLSESLAAKAISSIFVSRRTSLCTASTAFISCRLLDMATGADVGTAIWPWLTK